jgi:hypothetical protein
MLKSVTKLSSPHRKNTRRLSSLEVILVNDENNKNTVNKFIKTRATTAIDVQSHAKNFPNMLWSLHRSNLQLDCIGLDKYYISGKNDFTEEENIKKWNEVVDARIKYFDKKDGKFTDMENITPFDQYNDELSIAIAAVQSASFVSRSLQFNLVISSSSLSKDDKSPVILIIYYIECSFKLNLNVGDTCRLCRSSVDRRCIE